ncbi:LOW QUALITY PROTEIN: hypothetical protein OSB04_017232 [Centaurea solstitialis]|uniref:Uncharacterized protein n=1 Tax=Centaurea solstitialis TaxID=347529 RepID=A0AA38WAI4_9ASTR|nr:LOW QUALITY PROTEIN: hypothetical protein OSB04_017232 [Centaurea solstitialis]
MEEEPCLSFIELIAKKIQEVENVYKEYTIGIFEVEFQINLIPNPTKVINVMIGMDLLSRNQVIVVCAVGSYPRPKWGIVGRVRLERTNQDGVLSGRDDEKVTSVWVRGLIGLLLVPVVGEFPSVFLEDLSGFSADRQIEFEFDLILGSAPLRRLLILWRHLGSKSYRVCVSTRRRRSSARVASFGVHHLRVVRKKNGSHRMCSGNRKLNKVTIRSRYLLPRIGDLFDQFQEAAWFRHQLQVEVEDIHKVAFRAKCGHCAFLARPFGLAAAQLHWWIYEPGL